MRYVDTGQVPWIFMPVILPFFFSDNTNKMFKNFALHFLVKNPQRMLYLLGNFIRKRWKLFVVMIILAIAYYVTRYMSHHLYMLNLNFIKVSRQALGEMDRLFKSNHSKNDFRHKYDTPFASQYNLNTKTNELPLCHWMEGTLSHPTIWCILSWGHKPCK